MLEYHSPWLTCGQIVLLGRLSGVGIGFTVFIYGIRKLKSTIKLRAAVAALSLNCVIYLSLSFLAFLRD